MTYLEKKIKDLAMKYNLTSILENFNQIKSEQLQIVIGFLGEFNAGKSMIINALLKKEILPAMERPTTKNIITVVPDSSVSDIEFYIEDNGKLREIEPLDFQEIALGRREGKAVIKVKPSKYAPEGFVFIDTPGLSSLDTLDKDITIGYLPFLDGAVICQDISFGSFTKSLLDFIILPELKEMLDKFIFVLTKTDRISIKNIEIIKKQAILTLKDFLNEKGIQIDNLEDRVITFSAKEALKNEREEELENFYKKFEVVILNRKKELLHIKRKNMMKKLAKDLITAINEFKNNIKFTPAEIDQKIDKVKIEIEELKYEEERVKNKLHKFEDHLKIIVEQIFNSYKNALSDADSLDKLNEVISVIAQEIENNIQIEIKRIFKVQGDIENFRLDRIARFIYQEVERISSQINIGKKVATALLIAGLGPLKGSGNVLEFVSGLGGKEIINRGAKIAIEESLKRGVKATGKDFLKKFMKGLAEVITAIDPVELFGQIVKEKLVSKKLEEIIPQISRQVSEYISFSIEDMLEDELFEPLEKKLRIKKETFISLKKEKSKRMEEIDELRRELIAEINELETLIEDKDDNK